MSTTTDLNTLTGTYAIDPTHSRVGFVARHAMVTKVRGSFNEFDGQGFFDLTTRRIRSSSSPSRRTASTPETPTGTDT